MSAVWAIALAQDVAPMPPAVEEAVTSSAHRPLVERMQAISKTMIGQPYQLNPLGEGKAPDMDPIVRYDAYDCLTFVEEVVALSMSDSPEGAARIRHALRYGTNDADYIHRHHLMALQWLPSAQSRGWIADRTASLGGGVRMDREITQATWAAWSQRDQFHHLDEQLPVGQATLNVLPIDEALEVIGEIPQGSLLLTIREDRAYRPVWVSHVGLVFHLDGKTYVRHATRLGDDLVKDHDLAWYLNHLKTYTNLPVAGVAVWEFIPPRSEPASARPER